MDSEVHRLDTQEILSSITDGVICAREDGSIIGFVGGASKIFDYNQEEVIEEPLSMLLVNIDTIENETDFPVNGIVGVTKDGSKLDIEIINHVYVSSGYEIWIVRDQTRAHLIERFLDKYHDDLHNELHTIVEKKSKAFEKLTLALVTALENANLFNDTETGNHILRVSDYSGFLAEKLGCDSLFIKKIRLYSGLHDVGKVGIPDILLKKNGRYSSYEIKQMQEHVVIGARMLNNPEIDEMARNIALYHHEKWDGTGYIKRLKGEQIPIEARIVSVVDIYDALLSERVYKKAYTERKTLGIIKKGAGKSFDPFIVDTFLKHAYMFRVIRNKYENVVET